MASLLSHPALTSFVLPLIIILNDDIEQLTLCSDQSQLLGRSLQSVSPPLLYVAAASAHVLKQSGLSQALMLPVFGRCHWNCRLIQGVICVKSNAAFAKRISNDEKKDQQPLYLKVRKAFTVRYSWDLMQEMRIFTCINIARTATSPLAAARCAAVCPLKSSAFTSAPDLWQVELSATCSALPWKRVVYFYCKTRAVWAFTCSKAATPTS